MAAIRGMLERFLHGTLAFKLALGGLCFSTCFGAWWMAVAVTDGKLFQMFFRFAISIGVGFYYVAMMRVAEGQKLFS